MPAGHLVTRLNTAFYGQVNLDHLEHARRQVVACGDLSFLLLVAAIEFVSLRLEAFRCRFELAVGLLVLQPDLEPLLARQLFDVGLGDLAARFQLVRTTRGDLTEQHSLIRS